MLKQIGKLITEPLRKDAHNRPLGWRMGMRLNHIHNDLRLNYPRTWNVIIQVGRALICKPFGHRWSRFEVVKYGDFGDSRTCRVCRISHGQHRGVDTYHETHRRGGWNKIAKP
ncbi:MULTISPECIES: hypothetical protein [unclassified Pseudomonas]|uniref:hypothetical protein n=1 Tax=unclassified Pseudomonas TaxID=196821 RepID=UPI0011A8D53F|nr:MULTISPECIES: hypothetical protein [unclassified Pseudomonas]